MDYQTRFVKLGKNPPNGFAYELFLDEKGEKYLNLKVTEFPLNNGKDAPRESCIVYVS